MKKIFARGYLFVLAIALPLTKIHAFAPGEGDSKLANPIKADSFQELVEKALNVVLQIGVPVAALFIVYSGFLFVKAQGNPEELTKAKTTFMWTIIGTAILLGAWVLAQGIEATIDSLKT